MNDAVYKNRRARLLAKPSSRGVLTGAVALGSGLVVVCLLRGAGQTGCDLVVDRLAFAPAVRGHVRVAADADAPTHPGRALGLRVPAVAPGRVRLDRGHVQLEGLEVGHAGGIGDVEQALAARESHGLGLRVGREDLDLFDGRDLLRRAGAQEQTQAEEGRDRAGAAEVQLAVRRVFVDPGAEALGEGGGRGGVVGKLAHGSAPG